MHPDDQIDESVPAQLVELFADGGDGRPLRVVACVCAGCGGRAFVVRLDDTEGAAERECAACGARAFLADSGEYWDEAEPDEAECPCGGGEFEAAVAFTLGDDGTVRWVTVGLLCRRDAFAGVYTDWKIDYTPTDHLLTLV
ncbi:hypothetical protein AB0M43_22720 [Longispora sp. NPDC051575]|uniref:hypothetical protein n=1 Tax=Longispora sp. NPDC051575 TaxID=3154943 RepID=UPI00343C740F